MVKQCYYRENSGQNRSRKTKFTFTFTLVTVGSGQDFVYKHPFNRKQK